MAETPPYRRLGAQPESPAPKGRRTKPSFHIFQLFQIKSMMVPMPIQSPIRHSIPLAERPDGARGAAALRTATRADVRVLRDDGTEDAIALPASALPALADLLDRLSTADGVTVLADDAEVTPEDAAGILGISRPLVRRRMDVGLLPFRRVGAHRRIRLADVLALRAREEPAREALEALAADTEDLERTYGL